MIDGKGPCDLNVPTMKTLTEQFLAAIEGYLARTGTKPSEFGRQAIGDPSLVLTCAGAARRRSRRPTGCSPSSGGRSSPEADRRLHIGHNL